MGRQDFSLWLAEDVAASRLALLALIEQRDKLLYVDAQELRREYMAKIGVFEEEILEAELNVSLLQRKIELIQTSLNRRETVDLPAVELQLEDERAAKLAKLESADRTVKELPELSPEEQGALQGLYRTIVRDFHPQATPNLTDTQKELYQRALDSYRGQNLEALQLIHDMLYDVKEFEKLTAAEPVPLSEGAVKISLLELTDMLATDYTLAADLYASFVPLESDLVLQNYRLETSQKRRELESEIESILAEFPFTARETLQSEQKTEAYLTELSIRLKQAQEEADTLNAKIERMMGSARYG